MRVALSVVILLSASLSAVEVQQRPDLSGTWVATTEVPRNVAAAPSPVFGARFAIAQDATHFALTRVGRDGTLPPLRLPLDGSEVRWRVPARMCEGDSERIEKIAADGAGFTYTLVGMIPAGGGPSRVSNVRYQIRPTRSDTIEVQGAMVQQGQSTPVATVYRKSAEALPPATPDSGLPKVKTAPAVISQAEWIAGTWIGATPNSGSVEERWTPSASGAMLGMGRTLRAPQQSASFEFLCIVEREGSLVYMAMPNARTPATSFVLTSITPDSATFENPAHDYPRLIRYSRLSDGSLQTTISAGGDVRAQSMILKRQ
jgi:hypothetical protein